MKRSITGRVIIVFLSVMFMIPSFVPRASATSGSTLKNANQIMLNPFRTAIQSLKFYDAENPSIYLGEQTATNIYEQGNTLWTPRYANNSINYHYPRVQMFASEPFLVNNQGLNVFGETVDDVTKYIVDPTAMVKTTTKDPVTGEYIYIAKVNVAYDIIIKTKANLPPVSFKPLIPITPLVGKYGSWTVAHPNPLAGFMRNIRGDDIFSVGKGYAWGYDWVAQKPQPSAFGTVGGGPANAGWKSATGVLAAEWDYFQIIYNANSEPTTHHVGGSIDGGGAEPIGITFALEDFRNPTQAASNINNNYGNRAMKVISTITTSAYPDIILYDYFKNISGNVFEVKSNRAEMGFYDAKLIPSLDSAGRVPTFVSPSEYFTLAQVPVTAEGIASTVEALTTTNDVPDKQFLGLSDSVYYKFRPPAIDSYLPSLGPTPTYALGKPSTFPLRNQVTVDNFDAVVPKAITVTMDDIIQPYAKKSECSYEGKAVGLQSYGAFKSGFGTSTVTSTWTDTFPYRMTIENTFIVHRVVITCLAKTVNNILYIAASGEQVNVDDFRDYGINYLGVFDPTLDNAGGKLELSNVDPLGFLEDIFVWIIIIAVVIGVLAIFGAIASSRKKGNQQQQQQPSFIAQFLGQPGKMPEETAKTNPAVPSSRSRADPSNHQAFRFKGNVLGRPPDKISSPARSGRMPGKRRNG